MSDDDIDEVLPCFMAKKVNFVTENIEKVKSKDFTRRNKGGQRSLHDAKRLESPYFTVHKLLSPASISVSRPLLLHVKSQELVNIKESDEDTKVVFDIQSHSADRSSLVRIIGTPSKEVSIDKLLFTNSTSTLHSSPDASSEEDNVSSNKSLVARRKTPLNVKNSLRKRIPKETSFLSVELNNDVILQPLVYDEALRYYLQKNSKYSYGSVSHEDGSALTTFKGGVQPHIVENGKEPNPFSHDMYGNISMATLAAREAPPLASIPAWNHLRASQKSRRGIRNLNTFPYVERSRMKKRQLLFEKNTTTIKKSPLKPLLIANQSFSSFHCAPPIEKKYQTKDNKMDDDINTVNTAKSVDSNSIVSFMNIDHHIQKEVIPFSEVWSNESNLMQNSSDVGYNNQIFFHEGLPKIDSTGSISSDVSFLDDFNEDDDCLHSSTINGNNNPYPYKKAGFH